MATKKLIILTGQSNCGRTALSSFQALGSSYAKYLVPLTNAKILNPYKNGNGYQLEIPRIETYHAGVNSSISDPVDDRTLIGPEASLLEGFGEDVYLYKCATGATDISSWITSWIGKTIFYNNLYRLFSQSKQNGDDLSLVGILWQQGESDAVDQAKANAYGDNLVTLFSNLDRTYGTICTAMEITKKTDYKKVLFMTKGAGTYLSTVESAKQTYVGANENSYYFDVTDDAFGGDNLHYTALSYINQGIRLLNYHF